MTSSMRRSAGAMGLGAVLCTLPACGTQEIGSDRVVPQKTQTRPDQGALMIVSAPSPEDFARRDPQGLTSFSTEYEVHIDGKLLVLDHGGWVSTTILASEVSLTRVGFLDAGTHHVTIAVAQVGPVVFEGDVTLWAGEVTRLCLFGPQAALRSVVMSYPLAPPTNIKHVHVVNMTIDDVAIEVVSCENANHCTPVSPPLAAGDVLHASFPLTVWDNQHSSLSAEGAGIAWRQVATAALPDPPLLPMSLDAWIADAPAPVSLSVSFAVEPMYMAADGTPLMLTN